MTPIQRTPWKQNFLLALVASAFLGVPVIVVGLINGVDLGVLLLVALSIAALVIPFALIAAPLVYKPFSVDLTAGTALMGRRLVPISTIREVWRSIKVGTRSTVLYYRFHSTEGPQVRVLVTGSGVTGLDVAGRQALIDFLRIAPIDSPTQVADMTFKGWQRVPTTQLLAELPLLDLDYRIGVDEETRRQDAILDGRDPDERMLDDRLR